MLEWKIASDGERLVLYKKGTKDCMLFAMFNKEIKAVDVWIEEFISNGTPRLEPMNEWIKYSAKYGHFQKTCPTLGVEDVEFLHQKTKELFGGDNQ